MPLDPAVGAASSICEGYAVPGSCHGRRNHHDGAGRGRRPRAELAHGPTEMALRRRLVPEEGTPPLADAAPVSADGGVRTCGSARTRSSMDASASSKKENHAFLERITPR